MTIVIENNVAVETSNATSQFDENASKLIDNQRLITEKLNPETMQEAEKAMNTIKEMDKPKSGGLRSVKNDVEFGKNKRAGLVGGVAAVAIELISESGTTKSAIVAGVCSAIAYNLAEDHLADVEESDETAFAVGLSTFAYGFLGGRITAKYFPGSKDEDE